MPVKMKRELLHMQMRAGAYEIPRSAISRTSGLGGSLFCTDVLLLHASGGIAKQPGQAPGGHHTPQLAQ